MAASVRAGTVLTRAFLTFEATFKKELLLAPRALTQIQTRGRRRTCRPPSWFVKRSVKSKFAQDGALTPSNLAFIKEAAENQALERISHSPLKDGPWESNEWSERTLRTGVLAIKIGVVPQWTKDGKKFYTTMLQVLDNHVIRYIQPEDYNKYKSHKWKKNHYGMVVVGALSCDPLQFSKDYNNLFAESGVPPKRKLTRFLVTPDAAIQPGTPLDVNHFKIGQYIDAQAKTIGYGFQGVVKRWGFKGGPASHGATKFHRRGGATGGGGDKAAIWKGKKMPGHMGMDWRTLKGLKVWRINTKYNILYVTGQNIPGPIHCYVRIMDTKLHYRRLEMKNQDIPMPTRTQDEELPDEILAEDLYDFNEPSIVFEEEKKATVDKKSVRNR